MKARFAIPVIAALLLAGCAPGTGSVTPDGAEPSDSPLATESPTPMPTDVPISLPTCGDVLDPTQVSTLIDPAAQGIGDATTPAGGGRGTTVLELLQIMDSDPGALHCTWVVPGSDGGATLSIMSDPAAVEAGFVYLSSLTLEETTGSTGERILTIRSMDGFAYTESHGFLNGVWVAAWDGFGTEASGIVDAAFATLATRNPRRF